jgi:ParB-like chromosome segregation protein Spo0J
MTAKQPAKAVTPAVREEGTAGLSSVASQPPARRRRRRKPDREQELEAFQRETRDARGKPEKPRQFEEPSAGGYQLLPPLTDEERADLTKSIEKFGVRQAVTVDENNIILDGHHRAMIAAQLGVQYPIERVTDLSDQDKRRMVRQLNLARRHLTREQKQAIIADALRDEPEKSDRQVAADLGVSPTTVGTVRRKLEDSGDVSNLDTRTDTRGRQQPSTKKSRSKSGTAATRTPRWTGKSSTSSPEPQSREDQMAEAMVASFRDGLGKAKVLPPERVRAELAPLRSELLDVLGYEFDQEEVT